jgi:hypothetical protein
MKLAPRMAFRCLEPPRHIHVALFDPTAGEDAMLLVNFTTLRDTCVDEACILTPDDYAALTHATTVAYSRAMTGRRSAFERAVAYGLFIQLEDLPEAAWRLIVQGAHRSPELSAAQKRLLPLA